MRKGKEDRETINAMIKESEEGNGEQTDRLQTTSIPLHKTSPTTSLLYPFLPSPIPSSFPSFTPSLVSFPSLINSIIHSLMPFLPPFPSFIPSFPCSTPSLPPTLHPPSVTTTPPYLHPGGKGGVKAPVKGDGIFNVWRQVSGDVQDLTADHADVLKWIDG